MTEPVLLQERVVTRFEFQLELDGIAVTEQDGVSKRSYRVPFESLTASTVDVTVWSKPKLWAAGVLGGLSTLMMIIQVLGGEVGTGAALVYAVAAAIGVALFARSRQTYLVVKGDPALVLMKDRPSADAVAQFLNQVQERRRIYLAQRYLLGTQEGALVDAVAKLAALRAAGSISETEFETLKADVFRRANESRPFRASSN